MIYYDVYLDLKLKRIERRLRKIPKKRKIAANNVKSFSHIKKNKKNVTGTIAKPYYKTNKSKDLDIKLFRK